MIKRSRRRMSESMRLCSCVRHLRCADRFAYTAPRAGHGVNPSSPSRAAPRSYIRRGIRPRKKPGEQPHRGEVRAETVHGLDAHLIGERAQERCRNAGKAEGDAVEETTHQ